MPIEGVEYEGEPGFLQEYTTPAGSAMGEAFTEATENNPFTRFMWWQQAGSAKGNRMSKEDALARAKEEGVSLEVPDDGMVDYVVETLIEREYQKKKRQDALATAEGGFVGGAAQLTGGLGGSLLDPVGVAASFIPFVGQARYAALLGKAAGPVGRAAVRAGVGAVEGGLGNAILEPANLYLAKQLGDDYGFTDSLLNIGFGTVMGAGLHMGAGALSDAVSRGIDWRAAEPKGKVAERVSRMAPETRQSMMQGAIAQVIEDRPVNVMPIVMAHETQVTKQLDALDQKIVAAVASGDTKLAAELTAQKLEFSKSSANFAEQAPGVDAAPVKILDQEIFKSDPAAGAKTVASEVEAALARGQDVQLRLGQDLAAIKSVTPEGLVDVKGTVHKLTDVGNPGNRLEIVDQKGTDLPAGQAIEANSTLRSMNLADPEAQGRALREAFHAANTQANSRFMNRELVEAHTAELKSSKPELRVEEAKESLDAAMADLKEFADQAGLDLDAVLKDASDGMKSADEYSNALKAMAVCLLRKG